MTATVLFYAYAAVAVAGAAGLVAARRLVHAVMSLFATLVAVAALFLYLNSEFLAGMQLFVYGGAITVLVLFVLMLTRGTDPELPARHTAPIAVRTAAAASSLALLGALLFTLSRSQWPALPIAEPTTGALAESLFTRYVVGFETAGLILTVALIGAIVVARDDDTHAHPAAAPESLRAVPDQGSQDAGERP